MTRGAPVQPRGGRASIGVSLASSLPALAAYVATLNPTVPAGDSGELITAAVTLGVAHPPGYPLYVLAGWLWSHLLPVGEPALRLNLMSALCAAASCGVLGLVVHRLTGSIAAALVAAWSLAFSAPLWKMAVVAEVFAPNALLAACALAAFAAWSPSQTGAAARRRLAALALVTALALSLHHTLLLLVLPLIVANVVARRRHAHRISGAAGSESWTTRDAWIIGGAVAIGLSPLLLLPLAARSPTALVWGDPATLRGFLRVLTRADYGTFRLDPVGAGMHADQNHGWLYLQSLPAGVGVPAVVLAIAGAIVAWRRHRRLAYAALAFAVLQGLFFSRVGFPSDVPVLRGAVERFYIVPDLVLCLLAGLGADAVIRAARIRAVAPALATLALVWPVAANARLVDQRGNRFTEHLGRAMLASVPAHGVLFVMGDLQHNALEYLTRVRGLRPDVTIVDQELLTYDWYARRVRREAPDAVPQLGRAERIQLADGRTVDGLALSRADGRVDLLLEDGNVSADRADIAHVEPVDPSHMFARTRAGFHNDWLVPASDDRYSGLPGTRNLLWLEQLRGRRPAAFMGTKDDSWTLRWELVPIGLVAIAYPQGESPSVVEQATRTLDLLPLVSLDDYFRRYDPSGFESSERAQLSAVAARAALLLCQPGTEQLGAPGDPTTRVAGRVTLRAFAERFEALNPTPDPDCLRAIGLFRVFGADAHDPVRARSDLTRYLATGPSGPEADEARRVLGQLDAQSH